MVTRRLSSSSVAAAAVVFICIASVAGAAVLGIAQEGCDTHRRSAGAGLLRDRLRVAPGRRSLIGPGSLPPTCHTRCGSCAPCLTVRVAIHPGRIVPTADYYPEVWRCKCGDQLFLP